MSKCLFAVLGLMTASVAIATPASASTFSQTQTAVEQDLNKDGTADPFDFSFTGLDPVDASATGFTLDLDFVKLDLNNKSTEFLTAFFNPASQNINLGLFPLDEIFGSSEANVAGKGSVFVDFSKIGGLANFTEPFTIRLQPSKNVGAFDAIGSASLTLSYDAADSSTAVPEPMTILGLLTVAGIGAAATRKPAM